MIHHNNTNQSDGINPVPWDPTPQGDAVRTTGFLFTQQAFYERGESELIEG